MALACGRSLVQGDDRFEQVYPAERVLLANIREDAEPSS
jgi:hypothetical protein